MRSFARSRASSGREARSSVEVVYVDDGTSDDTLKIARALPAASLDVQVMALSRNFGKEAALPPASTTPRAARCCSWMATGSTRPR